MPRARERPLPNESHLLLLRGKTEAKKRRLEGEYKPDERAARSDRSTIHGKFKVVHATDGSREYVQLTRELGSFGSSMRSRNSSRPRISEKPFRQP